MASVLKHCGTQSEMQRDCVVHRFVPEQNPQPSRTCPLASGNEMQASEHCAEVKTGQSTKVKVKGALTVYGVTPSASKILIVVAMGEEMLGVGQDTYAAVDKVELVTSPVPKTHAYSELPSAKGPPNTATVSPPDLRPTFGVTDVMRGQEAAELNVDPDLTIHPSEVDHPHWLALVHEVHDV